MVVFVEFMVSVVWINKERRYLLFLDEVDFEVVGMLEEVDRGCS